MTDPRDVTPILRDISLLYELSLSVGRSIDLHDNCDGFLRTLMARKNLDFASVWIRDEFVNGGEASGSGLTQVYANPAFREPVRTMPGDHPLVGRVAEDPFFSVTRGEPGFGTAVAETLVDRGTFAVYRLGDIGLLKLYSIARTQAFPRLELSKLRHVVEQFTVSLEGCLDHARVRAAEERRRELEQQMLHAQKLESLGLLAGGVAHDFNNLLTAIVGNAELALPDSSAAGSEHLENVIGAATRAAGLCSQLLAYSGRGQFVIEPLSLNEVMDEMLRLTAVTLSKKARVKSDLAATAPAMEGDPTQVRQVVLNLLTNASEALGDGDGDLRLRTGTTAVGAADLKEFFLGEKREPGDYVFLEVADTGCGMAPETLGKLFDPFYTTKFTGRGLGMAAVLGIVRGHGGAIRVRSAPGVGTTVRVIFRPCATAQGQTVGDGRADVVERPGRVLIADDEEPVRALLARLLSDLGFETLLAADGGQALRLYEEHGAELDLAVLDLTMPVMGGDEVFAHIGTASPHLPVVLTSGYSEVEAADRLAEQSPAAFLPKPFRQAQVERVVREVLAARSATLRD